jgi:hypothetical protein
MSLALQAAIQNASTMLQTAIPSLAPGQPVDADFPHGLGVLFRQRGVSQMLLDGVVSPLRVAQMQASSVYAFLLRQMADADKTTSRAACFWDAVGAGYEAAAGDIARTSRMSANGDREHEDDFEYVACLMRRYYLAPPDDADDEARAQHERQLQDGLDRWEAVLETQRDPRFELCQALQAGDASAFENVLMELADAREADLANGLRKGALTEAQIAWVKPIWPEGLALLRLAERDGLALPESVPMVPTITRAPGMYQYDANAWRVLDFRPVRIV